MEDPDSVRVNVHTGNVVARIRKAGCRHRAHVAQSDYCNLHAKLNLRCIRHTAGSNRRIPQPVYAHRPVPNAKSRQVVSRSNHAEIQPMTSPTAPTKPSGRAATPTSSAGMVSDISSESVEPVKMRFQPAMGELILNRRRLCGFAIAGNRTVGESQVLFDDSIGSLPARHSRRNQ